MKQRLIEKQKAILLRKKGLSYKEIMNEISVSKGTLSGWLSLLPLNEKELELLNQRVSIYKDKGRLKSSLVNRNNRIKREEENFKKSKIFFDQNVKNPFFTLGIILYWCEGTKKSNFFSFINSDPSMLLLMNKWINLYLKPLFGNPKYRLYIHNPYKNDNCEKFWMNFLKIPKEYFYKTIYKPTPHTIKKNPIYKGCLRITFTKVNSVRTVMVWQKLLLGYYKTLKMHP